MADDRRPVPNKQLAVPSRALYLAVRGWVRGMGVKNELLEYMTVKLFLCMKSSIWQK